MKNFFAKKRVIVALFFVLAVCSYILFQESAERSDLFSKLDHSKYIYSLELNSKDNISYLTGISVVSGELTRFKLGEALYNNVSLVGNKAFLSIYRTYDTFGLEAAGKEVHVVSLENEGKSVLSLSGYSPTDVLILNDKIFIKVRGLDFKHPDGYTCSGFEVFDLKTQKNIGSVKLNENFPGIDWAYTNDKSSLFLFAENVSALRSRSPYISNNLSQSTGNYEIFFEIDTNKAIISKASLSEFSSVGNFVEHKDNLIIPFTSQNESGLYIYSILQKKLTKKYIGLKPMYMLKKSVERNELYGVTWEGVITIFDLETFKAKKELAFSGIRDMVIKGNKLFLIRRSSLVNGYEEEPKITIVNLDTYQKSKDILGVFGPFAKVFD